METPPTDAVLADVLAELAALEPIFHGQNRPASRAAFEALTAPDFWEVGASGVRYDREEVWSAISERVAAGDMSDAGWMASGFAVRSAGCATFLLTYTLAQGSRVSRRLTVWQLRGGSWRALYHQGTLVSGEG